MEADLMASLPAPRIPLDAHAHLWRRADTPQPWIDPGSMRPIDRDFWLDDLVAMQHRAGIGRSVLVQTAHSPAETLTFLGLATDRPDAVAGVVGWVDLRSPAVADDLAALRSGRGGEHLVGIRHLVHQEPDAGWPTDARTAVGLAALGAAGLPFDLVVRPDQLGVAATLAGGHPDTVFVLDHLGKPPLAPAPHRTEALERWRGDLAALAALPNTTAKLSGLVTEADWADWTPDELRPVVGHALDVFGAERLMAGSDWPVSLLAEGQRGWVDTLAQLLDDFGLDAAARSAILGGTAEAVYRPAAEVRG